MAISLIIASFFPRFDYYNAICTERFLFTSITRLTHNKEKYRLLQFEQVTSSLEMRGELAALYVLCSQCFLTGRHEFNK